MLFLIGLNSIVLCKYSSKDVLSIYVLKSETNFRIQNKWKKCSNDIVTLKFRLFVILGYGLSSKTYILKLTKIVMYKFQWLHFDSYKLIGIYGIIQVSYIIWIKVYFHACLKLFFGAQMFATSSADTTFKIRTVESAMFYFNYRESSNEN